MNTTYDHEEEHAKGVIKMKREDTVVARMTFSRIDPNNIIVDHTAVDPKLKGTGTGKALVMHLVEWARANDQKVLPLCPFAKAIIERHPETHDILRR